MAQDQLQKFRAEMSTSVDDPYSVVLKASKLPMTLLKDSDKQSRANLLQVESYEQTFGSKKLRKKPKLSFDNYEDMVTASEKKEEILLELLQPDLGVEHGVVGLHLLELRLLLERDLQLMGVLLLGRQDLLELFRLGVELRLGDLRPLLAVPELTLQRHLLVQLQHILLLNGLMVAQLGAERLLQALGFRVQQAFHELQAL